MGQDESTWSIKIGGGFHSQKNPRIYPTQRLSDFLNFNPKSEKDVADFCTRYQIIPRDYMNLGILKAFKKDQKELKEIASKIVKQERLTDGEFQKMKFNINLIHKDIAHVDGLQIDQLNRPLSGTYNEIPQGSYPIDLSIHGDSMTSLWEDLKNAYINSQLNICIYCGSFYRKTNRHNRKFCFNPNCSNKFRQTKFIQKHKI
jgi:hypothetical protein